MSALCDVVHAFADGELSPAETEQFTGHLATCTKCQAELADIMQLATAGAAIAREGVVHAAPAAVEPSLVVPLFVDPTPLRRPWYRRGSAIAGVALSMAAAVLLTVVVPRDRALPEYSMNGPTGFVELTRGSTASTERPRVFVPDGIVAFRLLPAEPISGATPALGIFVAGPGSTLARIEGAEIRATEQGAFAVRANAKSMFGATPGEKSIYLVVAPTTAELDALRGRELRALENRSDLRVHTASVEYQITE